MTCGVSPGTVLELHLGSDGIEVVKQADILKHDGSMLSDVSAGLRINRNKVLLGSPHSEGVLICTLEV